MTPAAAATWSGAGADNNWSTIENWDSNAVPTADDAVTFPASMPRLSNVNDIGPFAFNSITIVDEYTITSTHAITTPTIDVSTNATLAVPLVIPGAGLITITQTTATKTLTLSGLISGTGGINLAGAGIIELTGAQANTYTGMTTVATTTVDSFVRLARTAESIPGDLTITGTGTVKIEAGSSQIHYASLVTVLTGGVLNISQATGLDSGVDNETIGALAGGGSVILGDRKLGCFYAPLNSTFSGTIAGSVSSSFRKHGSYIQKLSGVSAGFEGTTVLNGSSLTILGNQPSSNISATAGTLRVAHLASVGSITMTGTSNLAVGNEVNENQAFSKNLSLASTTRMDVFSGSTSSHSTLTVVGTVALGNATLTVNTDVAPPTAGTELLIIANDGTDAISGTFAGLPEGETLISSGVATPVAFTISYVGGADNNDVVLTAVGPHTTGSPAITSASTATGTVGTAFSFQVTTSPAATSYTASNLPTGLAINTATGVISGTPTIAEDKSVLLTATNASGSSSGTLAITISGTGPGPGGGNPLPPGPTSSSTGGSDGGCGLGATGLALILLFGLTLSGTSIRQRR